MSLSWSPTTPVALVVSGADISLLICQQPQRSVLHGRALLTASPDGSLNHTNSVVAGTATQIPWDTEPRHCRPGATGHRSPDLPADKIVTGQFGTGFIADDSVTLEKLSDYSISTSRRRCPAAPTKVISGCFGIKNRRGSCPNRMATPGCRLASRRLSRLTCGGRHHRCQRAADDRPDRKRHKCRREDQRRAAGCRNQLGGLYVLIDEGGDQVVLRLASFMSRAIGVYASTGEGWIRINTLVVEPVASRPLMICLMSPSPRIRSVLRFKHQVNGPMSTSRHQILRRCSLATTSASWSTMSTI